MSELSNCKRCFRLFMRMTKDICPQCVKEIEAEYKRCWDFLQEPGNRFATVDEVSDGAGVTVEQILIFIREGRIQTQSFPNLIAPCKQCGKPVVKGSLCNICMKMLKEELDNSPKSTKKIEGKDHLYYKKKD